MTSKPSDPPVLNQFLSSPPGLAVCWLGNDGWIIRGQGRLIAFDLDLESGMRLGKPPVSTEELAPALEALFISHEHGDHFNDATAAILARQSRCLFVLPANCIEKAQRLGIPDARRVIARPRQPLNVLGITVRPMRAFHGHHHQSVYHDANLDDCGYLLTLDGRTLLQPGDSVLTQDHLDVKSVDILFVSPTAHNMHIQPALHLIHALRPGWIFPQHFETYRVTQENAFWTVGYPDELRAALPDDLRRHYYKLDQGQVFRIGALT